MTGHGSTQNCLFDAAYIQRWVDDIHNKYQQILGDIKFPLSEKTLSKAIEEAIRLWLKENQ